ncbi:hypothetical protein DRP04_00740 [Archaeoglobales archaeon]|nr:MAG: hypothetical protein DRP04_00740 [Archaeoglobales archaeon]
MLVNLPDLITFPSLSATKTTAYLIHGFLRKLNDIIYFLAGGVISGGTSTSGGGPTSGGLSSGGRSGGLSSGGLSSGGLSSLTLT